ncbi:MAG: hypothetical protein U0K70_00905, partial [Acutalibacteraceae bacterium]|nr:hypothetical protein [Acutalibacteraceae bacterium]
YNYIKSDKSYGNIEYDIKNAMNNLSQKGDYASSCLFFTKDNWVGTTTIPLLNANNYTFFFHPDCSH